MVEFRIAPHTRRPVEVIEVWVDGAFSAAIYPHGPDAIRLVSSHLAFEPEKETDDPPAWRFTFQKS